MMRALAALLLFFALGAHAETLTGYVVSITDGDTIVVLDAERKQHKIRLAGIDAPEEHQPFGERSKQNIATLTFNKTVTVEWRKTHRERFLGKVMVGGVDANLAQVRAGLAWWYEKYRKEQSPSDQRLYQEAEQQARAQRIGLWRDPAPVAPWDWRHAPSAVAEQDCPCGGGSICTGKKGGRYCVMPSGGKRYQ